MNEVKLSTEKNVGPKANNKLSFKLNLEALNSLGWNQGDTIRVKSYPQDGRIVLKKVGKKVDKTICHTLTSTGGSAKSHGLGFRLKYSPKRFKHNLAEGVKSISAAVRYSDKKGKELEIFLPTEIYAR